MANAYAITVDNQTVVASATLTILRAATAVSSRGSLLEIDRISISQRANATSAQVGIAFGLKASAFGTYVSNTPSPLMVGGPASAIAGGTTNAAATCGVNASAEGAGTFTAIVFDNFNALNGYLWVPTPEERIIVMPDTTFALKLTMTPGTLTGWTWTVVFRELN